MSEGQNLFNAGDVAFGKYRIGKLLGSGAFGEVYDAVEISGATRHLALKILLPKHNSTPTIPERFQAEARYLKEIRTRRRTNAFPDVYDYGYVSECNMHFIALEKIRGTQILDKMQRHPTGMPAQDAVRYIIKILTALAEAHHAGIVHRDLKPENIMLTDQGEIRILDFGVAKSLDDELGKDQRMTKTGAYLGTPNYMSPEQCTGGKALDGRSDLFAVATILYEMLTGKDPFAGSSNPMTTMYKISHENPPLLPPSIPTYVQEAVMVGLQKDPNKRWQTAEEFIDALEAHHEESSATRSPTTFVPPVGAVDTADPGRAGSRPPPPVSGLPQLHPTPLPSPTTTPTHTGRPLVYGLAAAGVLMGVIAIATFFIRKSPPSSTRPVTSSIPAVVHDVPTTAVMLRDAAATPSPDVAVEVSASPPHPSPDAALPVPDRNVRRSRRDAGRGDRPPRSHAPRCRHGYTLTDGQCCRRLGAGGMDCDGNE